MSTIDQRPAPEPSSPERRLQAAPGGTPVPSPPRAPAPPPDRRRPATPASRETSVARPSSSAGPACRAGANGGATGTGVTANRIHLVAYAVLDGPKPPFYEHTITALKAVFDRVNRSGGVCGRLIEVAVVNRPSATDFAGWAENAFALMAVPLDGTVADHVAAGALDRAGAPLLASDSMAEALPASPWLWSLGPTPAAAARIAVDHAYRTLGARTFAVVYDGVNGFGPAMADAARDHVAALPGATLRTAQALDPDRPSYSHEVQQYNDACAREACDVTVLALMPETASKWLRAMPEAPAMHLAGSPFLFSERGRQGLLPASCPRLRVWSGFTPPVEPFLADPAVARYADDVGHERASATPVQAAYVAATAIVEALRTAGPELTRARLRAVLDESTFSSGLTGPLHWGAQASPDRVGIRSMRAFDLVADGSSCRWEDTRSGWVRDPLG